MKALKNAVDIALEEFAEEYDNEMQADKQHEFSSEFESEIEKAAKIAKKKRRFIKINKKMFVSLAAAAAAFALTVTAGAIRQGGIDGFIKYGFGERTKTAETQSAEDSVKTESTSVYLDYAVDDVQDKNDKTASKTAKTVAWEYEISSANENSVTITGYTGNVSKLKVPKKIDGYTVTAIGEKAINGNKNIKTLYIPDTVAVLEESAVYNCKNLKKVIVPNSVTQIGEKAIGYYYDKELDEDLLLDDITISCGKYSAAYYYAIDNMIANQTDEIEKMPKWEYNKSGRSIVISGYHREESEVEIPETINGKTVIGINGGAFKNNPVVTRVVIPETVRFVSDGAFAGCGKLEAIYIYNKTLSISGMAFAYSYTDTNGYDDYTFNNGLMIKAERDSTAYEYAVEYGIAFTATDDDSVVYSDEYVDSGVSSQSQPNHTDASSGADTSSGG